MVDERYISLIYNAVKELDTVVRCNTPSYTAKYLESLRNCSKDSIIWEPYEIEIGLCSFTIAGAVFYIDHYGFERNFRHEMTTKLAPFVISGSTLIGVKILEKFYHTGYSADHTERIKNFCDEEYEKSAKDAVHRLDYYNKYERYVAEKGDLCERGESTNYIGGWIYFNYYDGKERRKINLGCLAFKKDTFDEGNKNTYLLELQTNIPRPTEEEISEERRISLERFQKMEEERNQRRQEHLNSLNGFGRLMFRINEFFHKIGRFFAHISFRHVVRFIVYALIVIIILGLFIGCMLV